MRTNAAYRQLVAATVLGIAAVAPSLSLAQDPKPTDAPKPVKVARHQFAPIGKPYFFAWWGATAPSHKNFLDVLPTRFQTLECLMRDKSDRDWWLGRGVWPFGWSYGTQGPFHSADKFEKYILTRVNSGAVGICFDEWVGFDAETRKLKGTPEKKKYPGNPRNKMLAEACRRIKQRYPAFFMAACTHMQSDALIEALQKGWVDLAIVESYPYVSGEPAFTSGLAMWRLGNAKRAGVMEKPIPAFWITPKDETFTAEWLEGWIKRWRKEFPQMPGVAPFFPGGHDRDDPRTQHLARVCDRLIRKHYVDPAPKVQIKQPADGALVAEGTPVVVRAEASCPIAKWRLYVARGCEAFPREHHTPHKPRPPLGERRPCWARRYVMRSKVMGVRMQDSVRVTTVCLAEGIGCMLAE